jgi:L,D-peptidoglycan transpeptidase YkuD (ErfK/YbiS/YcfS/YnhG family)
LTQRGNNEAGIRAFIMKSRTVAILRVFPRPGWPQQGLLTAGNLSFPCALGRSGVRRGKREGDGATPVGRFALGRAYYRADRGPRPPARLPLKRLKPTDAWCDDPGDRRYNRPMARPAHLPPTEETMWRKDRLYDVVIEIAYNARPRVRGRGSAIFIHLAKPGWLPTAGCVALKAADMRKLVAVIGPKTKIVIDANHHRLARASCAARSSPRW